MAARKVLVRKTVKDSRRIEKLIRTELESGRLAVSDVIRSERELAAEHGVSRRTVRRALKQLVGEGYLAARPRGGYEVTSSPPPAGGGPVAFVQGTRAAPWEWSDFNVSLWNGFQEAGRDLPGGILVVSLGERSGEQLAASLCEQGVSGAIVDSDLPETTDALIDAGLPVVRVDGIHNRAPSITQDNFGAAFKAVEHLAAGGARSIAFAGCDFAPNPNVVHLNERLGGYLAALRRLELEVKPEWQILGKPGPDLIAGLAKLGASPGGPDAALLLWPELLEPLGAALSSGELSIPVVTWWGCAPERRSAWRTRFPDVRIPGGISWSASEMAGAALARLFELTSGKANAPLRTLVPVRLVTTEEG
ncbi:MAG: GntR family transcriptional regulator [Planctomycetota bacterium]|jgi:ABC-type sugar transport system substrate-binding protein